ncbi:MAG: hypothetical protein PHW04_01695 [Candidatus Wallbacteria bacterium]|nr:hypothetical protein [Candidatus Wallbacteria bacterium]
MGIKDLKEKLDRMDDYMQDKNESIPEWDEISGTVYTKMVDRTFGYLISSLAACFFLTFVFPRYYAVCSLSGSDPAEFLRQITILFLNPGMLISTILALLFFLGGTALYFSHNWGRLLLNYCFVFWGLIIIYEMRHGFGMFLSAEISQKLLALMLWFSVIPFIYAYFVYHQQRLFHLSFLKGLILIMMAVNLYIIFNSIFLAPAAADRHANYLPLAFFAVILMQTYEGLGTFFPSLRQMLHGKSKASQPRETGA